MKKIDANKIGKDVERRQKPRNESRWFLERAAPFNPNLRMRTDSKEFASKIFKELGLNSGYKISQKFDWFETLLANLFHYWQNAPESRRPVAISRNKNDWKKNRYNAISQEIINTIDTLKENGFIDMKKGFKGKNQARKTRIWPTKKLLHFSHKNCMVVWDPVQLVELRELNSNKRINYEDTKHTKRIRSELEQINEVNNSASIWHPNEGEISVHLISIYKGSFELYGRLHTFGPSSIQGLPAKQRRRLLIDDQPVAELDYSALHPHLIYAAEGIQYNGDPYLAGHQNPKLRPMFKIMLMAMLHADDKKQVFKAVNHWLYKNPDEVDNLIDAGVLPYPKYTYKQFPYGRKKKPTPRKEYIIPLIEKFADAHHKISHHFFNGKRSGLRIMNKDATIALAILKALTSKGVPCISIHDSFLVSAPYEADLRVLMQEKYKQVTGGFRCPVKQEYKPLEEQQLIGIETRFQKVS